MKKLFLSILSILIIQNVCTAKDILQFDFPNEGWHKVESLDGRVSKKCYVPHGQTAENHTEMLIFSERILKTQGLTALTLLHKQLGKDKNNYLDIKPEYVYSDADNAMVVWCSSLRNTCAVSRAFQAKEGVVFASYINKAPHYSQNMFGQWSNILSMVKVYEPQQGQVQATNLIDLN